MVRLASRDYEALQHELSGLYAHMDIDEFPRMAVGVACRLVPCDVAAYNEIDPERQRLVMHMEPDDLGVQVMHLLPTWERLMHQHPILRHYREHPNDRPRRISDFLSREQYQSLDIYREVYRHINCEHQVVTSMPAPAPLIVGLAQNRSDRDFSERDCAILDLLRPHLRRAYDNAWLVTELSLKVARFEHMMERMDRGLIVINDRLNVIEASLTAARFVVEHLREESLTATVLPETIRRWAPAQIVALRQNGEGLALPAPLLIDTATGRLVIRLIADPQPDRFVVVIQHAARLESSQPLRGLGLTVRESDVLYWCIEGKSRGEIGLLLGISERTVQKHLEHVYDKLDVDTRVAAVTKALEWLRL